MSALCPLCDFFQGSIEMLGYRKNMYLNYYEDRMEPYPYENAIYKDIRFFLLRKVIIFYHS